MKLIRGTAQQQEFWHALEKTCTVAPGEMRIRGSGLPLCPRAFWIDRHLGPFARRTRYGNEVMLTRGSAIHETIQKWLGMAGVLFGNWECPACALLGQAKKTEVLDHLGYPGKCKEHGLDLKYREYELMYRGLSGHPDGLLTRDRCKTFALLEVKTMNWPQWTHLPEPLSYHIEQANAYACILQSWADASKLSCCGTYPRIVLSGTLRRGSLFPSRLD